MANPENNTKNADEEFDLSKEFYKTRSIPRFVLYPPRMSKRDQATPATKRFCIELFSNPFQKKTHMVLS